MSNTTLIFILKYKSAIILIKKCFKLFNTIKKFIKKMLWDILLTFFL